MDASKLAAALFTPSTKAMISEGDVSAFDISTMNLSVESY
jgi:hypothetical protein